MQAAISPQQRQATKRQMIEQIEQGASVQQARSQSEVHMHRATVYRLLQRVQAQGETGYTDGRHGHPVRGTVAPEAIGDEAAGDTAAPLE